MPARAKLPPGGGKRFPLNMRTTREMREKLEKSAGESGRSLVQEVEYRMEQSFREEDALGGRECYALFRMLGAAADLIEARTGKSVVSDWETAVSVRTAWRILIDECFPPLPEKLKAKIVGSNEPLPPFPMPPSRPAPKWTKLKSLMSQEIIDDLANEQNEQAEYDRTLKNWQRRAEERNNNLANTLAYVEGLANIGRETALGLFPEKRKKQG